MFEQQLLSEGNRSGIDTYDSIFGRLAMRQTMVEDHPFFQYLRTNPSPQWFISFIPRMGFWVHAFQDALKLVEHRVNDEIMKRIAIHIRQGDTGHHKWFGRDMSLLGLPAPDLTKLFSPEHENTRIASYKLVSEIYRATDERLLIVFLLALESVSYVFFETMTTYLEETNFPVDLKYFGRTHLDAELHHGIVEAEMDMQVEKAVENSPHLRIEALELIDRVFDTFQMMFDDFLAKDAEEPSTPSA